MLKSLPHKKDKLLQKVEALIIRQHLLGGVTAGAVMMLLEQIQCKA